MTEMISLEEHIHKTIKITYRLRTYQTEDDQLDPSSDVGFISVAIRSLQREDSTCCISSGLYSLKPPSRYCEVPLMTTIRAGKLTPTARVEVAPILRLVVSEEHSEPAIGANQLTNNANRSTDKPGFNQLSIGTIQSSVVIRYTDFK